MPDALCISLPVLSPPLLLHASVHKCPGAACALVPHNIQEQEDVLTHWETEVRTGGNTSWPPRHPCTVLRAAISTMRPRLAVACLIGALSTCSVRRVAHDLAISPSILAFCACAGCLALAAGNPASYAPRTNTTAQVPSTGAIFTLYSDMQTYLGSAASCSNSNSTTLASVVSADEMAAINSLAVAFWSSDAGKTYLSAPASPPAQPGQPGSLGFWNASLFSGCVWIGAPWPCCSGVGGGASQANPQVSPAAPCASTLLTQQ